MDDEKANEKPFPVKNIVIGGLVGIMVGMLAGFLTAWLTGVL